MIIVYHNVASKYVCVKFLSNQGTTESHSQFNIGISGFHIHEGLGNKGYRAVIMYEGCSQFNIDLHLCVSVLAVCCCSMWVWF